jgi:hypothetical protein
MRTVHNYHYDQLLLIGRTVVATQPDFAASIIKRTDVAPIEKDLTKLPIILNHYLQKEGIKSLTPDTRRVFVGIALRLYKPEVYTLPSDMQGIKWRGLPIHLARVLDAPPSRISEYIRQIIFWEQTNFEGFGDKVQQAIKEINAG